MSKIFVGFLLIFLDFNLELGSSVIGLIPDFIGYVFVLRGLDALSAYSGHFVRVKPFALGMCIYSGVLYGMDLLGLSDLLGLLGVLLGAAGTVVSLYISYAIIQGIQTAETAYSADLNSGMLKSTWILMAVFQGTAYLAFWVPFLGLACMLALFVTSIVFLAAFYQSKARFETRIEPPSHDSRKPGAP